MVLALRLEELEHLVVEAGEVIGRDHLAPPDHLPAGARPRYHRVDGEGRAIGHGRDW